MRSIRKAQELKVFEDLGGEVSAHCEILENEPGCMKPDGKRALDREAHLDSWE